MTRAPRTTEEPTSHPGARIGILLAYGFNGFALTSWTVRLPSLQAETGMTTAQAGLFLTMSAVGTLVMVTLAGACVVRFGAARTYLLASALYTTAYAVLTAGALLTSIPLLLVGSVVHGFAFALTNVPQSVLAAASERAVGKTILPQFHASYSLGAMLGAGAAALLSAADVSMAALFTGLIGGVLVARTAALLLARPLDRDLRATERQRLAAAGPSPVRPRSGFLTVWRDPNTALLGLLIFAAGISEGTANNWGSLAVVEMLNTSPAQGAMVVTVFLTAQTAIRLLGGPAVDRFGRRSVLLTSAALAIAGVVVFTLSGSLVTAVVGAALWGAGSALGVPISISLAAGDARQGPAKVAAVTSLSSLANIAGPPLLGLAIQGIGVRLPIAAITLVILAAAFATSAAVRTSTRRAAEVAPSVETFTDTVALAPGLNPAADRGPEGSSKPPTPPGPDSVPAVRNPLDARDTPHDDRALDRH